MLKEVLTPREYEIVSELAKGYTEAYTAKKLGIAYPTLTEAVKRSVYKLRIPSDKNVGSPKSVLIAMYRKEHPDAPFWFHETKTEDTRKLPRNCGKTRGPEHVQFA